MKQITFSMNKLDPKSQDTSEALGARGAGGSHTQKTECVSTAAHRYRCSRFLLVPASLFACPLPFLSRNRRSLRQFVRKARLSTTMKFDGVTSCTTSIRPSVAFSDRGGARQSETVKGRAAQHRNHHSHLLIEEGKADGRRRLNRLHAACFAGSYDYTGPKTSFWPD